MSSGDLTTLREFGYAQELLRAMRPFQNIAVSFAVICILGGGISASSQATGPRRRGCGKRIG